jgi:hypothetical protein
MGGPSDVQVMKKKGLEIGVSLVFSEPKIHRLGRLFKGLRPACFRAPCNMMAGFLAAEATQTLWASVILVCQKLHGACDAKDLLGGPELKESRQVLQRMVDRRPVDGIELDM